MARDYLGPMIRAAVSVPQDRLPLLADIANRLVDKRDGGRWRECLLTCLQTGLPPDNPQLVTATKFVVRDRFKVGTGRRAKVKISGRGTNFDKYFLAVVEDVTAPAELQFITLGQAMSDQEIIAELGGVVKVVTSLQDIYAKLERQPHGPRSPAGDLLTGGDRNSFYVPQAVTKLDGDRFSYLNAAGKEVIEAVPDSRYLFQVNSQWYVLRAVSVRWYGDGWNVCVYPVEDPCRWYAGCRVFSRKALVPSVPVTPTD